MNQQQSEAYRLAAELDPLGGVESEAASELRRLHKENEDLLKMMADLTKQERFSNDGWERLNTEINRLHQCLRNVYEVWAGSEGIPAPTVASEAYLLSLVEQMRDAAKEGLNGG